MNPYQYIARTKETHLTAAQNALQKALMERNC